MKLERTLLDRVVGFVSPRAGLERVQSRLAMRMVEAHYEAGSEGRRTDSWITKDGGPSGAKVTLGTIRKRSRDLVRNNPWAKNAIEDIETETIGTGILPRIRAPRSRTQKRINELWKAWAETTACDADGVNDIYGLMALAMRTIAESGEVLIRRRRRALSDGLPIPLQIQVLEPDYLDTARDLLRPDGTRIVGGVEYNAIGQRLGYWILPAHPDESVGFGKAGASMFVPADAIAHVYRVERPGQVRGIPWGASAIIRLRDFDEYEDAQLVRQKIAACFAIFMTDVAGGTPGALAGLADPGDPTSPAKPKIERVFPGMIRRLGVGEDIKFANPPSAEGQDVYSRVVLRAIAAGYGTTYEALTGDYSNVNFSSGRLGHLRHYRRIQAWRWRIIVPRVCTPIWNWMLDSLDAMGEDVRDVTSTWNPPAQDMIDPAKEVVATRTEIRAGLKTPSQALRERGYDPEEFYEEYASDRDRLDEDELIVESDARRPSNGQPGDPSAQVDPAKKAADQAAADQKSKDDQEGDDGEE